ncbi:MAG TPA: NUDIX domain-containing protein, partial [Roseibacterium sp.]|nr:NUDIX domain-containing protein [Roseibacterium sp.]
MNRRFDNAPEPGRYYPPRPGAYAIIDTGDGLLASFQDRPVPELQLPGGGIDPGEHPIAALHREVMEETGYRIHSLRRLGM